MQEQERRLKELVAGKKPAGMGNGLGKKSAGAAAGMPRRPVPPMVCSWLCSSRTAARQRYGARYVIRAWRAFLPRQCPLNLPACCCRL